MTNLPKKKNKGGRPTKMTPQFIEVMRNVIEKYVYCTDEEIIFMINEQLPENQQISITSFKDWKAGRQQADNQLFVEFSSLVKTALIKEKMALLKALRAGEPNWQSKAWILERKFSEWNIRNEQKIILETKQLPKIQILQPKPTPEEYIDIEPIDDDEEENNKKLSQ